MQRQITSDSQIKTDAPNTGTAVPNAVLDMPKSDAQPVTLPSVPSADPKADNQLAAILHQKNDSGSMSPKAEDLHKQNASGTTSPVLSSSPPPTVLAALNNVPPDAKSISVDLKSDLDAICDAAQTSDTVRALMRDPQLIQSMLFRIHEDTKEPRLTYMAVLTYQGGNLPISKEKLEIFEKQIPQENHYQDELNTNRELQIKPPCAPSCVSRKTYTRSRYSFIIFGAILGICYIFINSLESNTCSCSETEPSQSEKLKQRAGYIVISVISILLSNLGTLLSFVTSEKRAKYDNAVFNSEKKSKKLKNSITNLIKLENRRFKLDGSELIYDFVQCTDLFYLNVTEEQRDLLRQHKKDIAKNLDLQEARYHLLRGIIDRIWFAKSKKMFEDELLITLGNNEVRLRLMLKDLQAAIDLIDITTFKDRKFNPALVGNDFYPYYKDCRRDREGDVAEFNKIFQELPREVKIHSSSDGKHQLSEAVGATKIDADEKSHPAHGSPVLPTRFQSMSSIKQEDVALAKLGKIRERQEKQLSDDLDRIAKQANIRLNKSRKIPAPSTTAVGVTMYRNQIQSVHRARSNARPRTLVAAPSVASDATVAANLTSKRAPANKANADEASKRIAIAAADAAASSRPSAKRMAITAADAAASSRPSAAGNAPVVSPTTANAPIVSPSALQATGIFSDLPTGSTPRRSRPKFKDALPGEARGRKRTQSSEAKDSKTQQPVTRQPLGVLRGIPARLQKAASSATSGATNVDSAAPADSAAEACRRAGIR